MAQQTHTILTVSDLNERLIARAVPASRPVSFYLRLRMGPLRELARELADAPIDWSGFDYKTHYELNLLRGLIVAYGREPLEKKWAFYREYFRRAEDWSYVDSVAVTLSQKDKREIWKVIPEFARSPYPYLRRFGFVLALVFLVKDGPLDILWPLIDDHEPVYHVYMAIAWLLAEIFIKRRQEFLQYMNRCDLDVHIRQKMVSKIRDSYRVSKNDKEFAKIFKDKKVDQ
ncbi:MAG: DNA alkylation repair protein [Bacilli bacterium]|jgi:3-methyladenine DNA glycosylase AlkD